VVAPTTKSEEVANKKIAKKSSKSEQNEPKKSEKPQKKVQKPRKRVKADKAKTTQEKLQEVQKAAPLKQAPIKKASGRKQDDLTAEQRAQLNAPLRKVGSSKSNDEAPKEATDADLEKLKAFFGKKN